ncbi:hypothetical protein TB1_013568 [Malus domestica]
MWTTMPCAWFGFLTTSLQPRPTQAYAGLVPFHLGLRQQFAIGICHYHGPCLNQPAHGVRLSPHTHKLVGQHFARPDSCPHLAQTRNPAAAEVSFAPVGLWAYPCVMALVAGLLSLSPWPEATP